MAMSDRQMVLPLGTIRNHHLFSNHWLEHRLRLEPEWQELRDEAEAVLNRLADLWRDQRGMVQQYGDEQGLEQAFIQPVLQMLGWRLKYQTFLRSRKPDYALFLEDASLRQAIKAGRTSPDFWKYPALLADAKAWGRSLDRPTKVRRRGKFQREYPPEQIEWYLNNSELAYAVLTNGRLWRLVPRAHSPDQPRFETYLECDLAAVFEDWEGRGRSTQESDLLRRARVLDEFLRFYLFFSPVGVRSVLGRTPLVQRAAAGSSEYRLGVGARLKERVFEALRLCIEGFLKFSRNNLDPERHLALCHEQSFILLYRLLFIMYAEDRHLLPYRSNRLYRENRSLGRYRDEIANRLDRIPDRPEEDYSCESTRIWSDLLGLFDIIDNGRGNYDVPAYNGGLFDPQAHPFLAEKALPDCHIARLIDQLGRAPDAAHPEAALCRVDYRELAIQHLGSIYEGLLELRSHWATEAMVVVTERKARAHEVVIRAADPIPDGYKATTVRYEPGCVYLVTDKGERRATGSYYTPNKIVDYIIEKTLHPLCRKIHDDLEAEIAKCKEDRDRARGGNREAYGRRLAGLAADFDDRVLRLRILDPAMGSGHFLLSACQYLAQEIATNPNAGDPEAESLGADESTLTFWKRKVIERCLYGVDLNPLAVELAKLALWLETISVNRPLTFLDHHLRCGNSLVGGTIDSLDALPGAPDLFERAYSRQVGQRLPVLLEPLERIRLTPSETAQQVKDKDKLYHKVFDVVRLPFLKVADLWCAAIFAPPGEQPTAEQYQHAVEALARPGLNGLFKEPWVDLAVAAARRSDVAAFHWELEFPEVFFDSTARRPEAGFDALIGNPPYDVLSEKESGKDLAQLRAFLESQALYKPSLRGKNNLYKLFICRALGLLAQGGRLGFIVPMPLLGDDQAADLRREMLRQGALTSVDAFPQKDDPERRVFPEAKLATAVFSLVKIEDAALRAAAFVARVHPEACVEGESPSLLLTSADIPKYDPSNFTIVTSSQADWDLAIRIVESGHMRRLKDFAEFFQGEVNETNEKAKGNLLPEGKGGKLVTRGASICLYVTRPASQGEDLYLNAEQFLAGKGAETKAFHHRHRRIGLQDSSPQNNFRRIIAAIIPRGEFCNHTVNYAPEPKCTMPLEVILALLDSRLAEWYFRLGSTNAHVSHYQLYNLPCPAFTEKATAEDRRMLDRARAAGAQGDIEAAFAALQPGLAEPPFSPAVRDVIVDLVNSIIAIETARGEIVRTDRSHLDPAAQPLQDLIDRLLYAMAGLTADEAHGLEERLCNML
jgi:hypothetical protein